MQLNQRLVIVASTTEVTAPVNVTGGNHVHFEVILYSGGVTVNVEGSIDGENWVSLAASTTGDGALSGVGNYALDTSSVKQAFVRLKYTSGSSGVLAASAYVSSQ